MSTSNNPLKVSVLIVGAGPAGLAAACELSRQGVSDFLIIDILPGIEIKTKASLVAPRTVELLSMYGGVMEKAVTRACVVDKISIMASPSETLSSIDLKEITSKSFFTVLRTWEQHWTEECITGYLTSRGVKVRRNTKLLSFLDHGESGVLATLEENGGKPFTVAARFIIGADGGRSTTRHLLNFKFEGETISNGFLSVHFKSPPAMAVQLDTLVLGPFPGGQAFVTPMPDATWLAAIELPPAMEAPFLAKEGDGRGHQNQLPIPDEEMISILKKRLSPDLKIEKIIWSSHFRINERLVEKYWNGANTFLVGDACHCHSPLGGQGMNISIQDSINLAWKVAFVVKGISSPLLLNSYEKERREVGKFLVDATNIGGANLSNQHPVYKFFRNNAMKIFTKFPIVVNYIVDTIGETNYKYPASSLTGEHWVQPPIFPHVLIRRQQNMLRLLTARVKGGMVVKPDLLETIDSDFYGRTSGVKVLIFQGLPGYSDPKVELTLSQLHDVELKTLTNPAVSDTVIISSVKDHKAFGVKGQAIFLVRPDGYVALRSEPVDLEIVNLFLESRILCKPSNLSTVCKAKSELDWAPFVFIPVTLGILALSAVFLAKAVHQHLA